MRTRSAVSPRRGRSTTTGFMLAADRSSAIARSTRTRAESLTGRVRFTTWETVVKDTPARAATCLMLLNARRSILAGVVGHVVGHLDLAGDDVGLRLVDLLLHVRRDELGVVLVERVVDAVFLQSERDQARLVALRRLVDGDLDALDHRGEHRPRLDVVLVAVHADRELSGILRCLVDADSRSARRREDDVGALGELRARELAAARRIVPRSARGAPHVHEHLGLR